MQDYLSEEVLNLRMRQIQRIQQEHGSTCDFEGRPLTKGSASSSARRRRLSAAQLSEQPTGRPRQRRLKASASATTTASAAVTTMGEGESEEDQGLQLKHFKGFFIMMALLLVFTLLTSPRLDWLAIHFAVKMGLKAKEEARRMSEEVKHPHLARSVTSLGKSRLSPQSHLHLPNLHLQEHVKQLAAGAVEAAQMLQESGQQHNASLGEGGPSAGTTNDEVVSMLKHLQASMLVQQRQLEELKAQQDGTPRQKSKRRHSTPRSGPSPSQPRASDLAAASADPDKSAGRSRSRSHRHNSKAREDQGQGYCSGGGAQYYE